MGTQETKSTDARIKRLRERTAAAKTVPELQAIIKAILDLLDDTL
jgi:hypothetical protein